MENAYEHDKVQTPAATRTATEHRRTLEASVGDVAVLSLWDAEAEVVFNSAELYGLTQRLVETVSLAYLAGKNNKPFPTDALTFAEVLAEYACVGEAAPRYLQNAYE